MKTLRLVFSSVIILSSLGLCAQDQDQPSDPLDKICSMSESELKNIAVIEYLNNECTITVKFIKHQEEGWKIAPVDMKSAVVVASTKDTCKEAAADIADGLESMKELF